MERQWKLGEDLFLSDCILDPITFDEIAMTVRCNCREVNEWTVRSTTREILSARLDDFYELLERNVGEIIKEVNKQKGIE